MIKTLRQFKNTTDRRKYLEQLLGVNLSNTGSYTLDDTVASKLNCENMIGVTQIPVGIAGPLRIQSVGRRTKIKNYYIPLSTTEGALVASVNRGCKAVGLSGGATVMVENVGTTRGSVFATSGLKQSFGLKGWLVNNFTEIKNISQKTSSHLKLLKIDTSVVANRLYCRFYYDTKDAMGMNMVTIATTAASAFIEKQTKTRCLSVAANFDVDKKPAWLNFILGRGKRVWAEITVNKKTIQEVLKTTPGQIHEVAQSKYLLGSIMSGSLGFNGHFANIISAIFIATGQDPGHVVEGSLGVTTTEVTKEGDLYFSIYLPDLMVGTIGGGTGLSTQKEALSILGIAGGDSGKNSAELAQIIGASVLAGELSLIASLAQGSLARAHITLARGKLKNHEITRT